MDLFLGGQFAGEPGKPLEVSHAQLSFGPLTARLVGAIILLDDAFKVDLVWNVPPLPCGVLLKKQSPLSASAEGFLVFDLHRPDKAAFTVTRAQTCGLPIFPD
jgi:hypothetical protein